MMNTPLNRGGGFGWFVATSTTVMSAEKSQRKADPTFSRRPALLGNVHLHVREIMKSVSLAAIFWCILIPSSETSKQFVADGCYCVCPPYQNQSKMIYWKEQFQDDCSCQYTVEPKPVPRHEVEAYCLLCDCKFVERNNTTTKIILIVFLSVFGAILLFKVSSMIVKHFIHKPDAYTKPLHNEEEESEDPHP